MKKKLFLIFVIGFILLYTPSVLAVDVQGCSSVLPGVKIDTKIPNTVSSIILIIKIVVPILLVVLGSMDLVKAMVAQKEDEIKKGQHILIKRLITGALVFFVITIVQFVISFVAGSDEKQGTWDCVNCFLNGADKYGNCK